MKKWLSWAALVAVTLLVAPLVVKAVTVNTSNEVSVASCEQIGSDIRIQRVSGEQSTVLTSACRDAGHGLRQYSLSCLSATKYRVSWSECSTPAPVPTPTDTQGPTVSIEGAVVGGEASNRQSSYRLTIRAQDALSNLKGVQVTVRDSNNQTVQSWWLDGGRAWSESNGFGTKTLHRTVVKSGLQSGQAYTVSVQAFDVRGNGKVSNVISLRVSTDTTAPSINADVTFSAQWYGGANTKRMVPTLVVRAFDSARVSKISLYYNNAGLNDGYTEIKTCQVNAINTSCSHAFSDLTRGNFYAVAWDEAGNSATSYKITF